MATMFILAVNYANTKSEYGQESHMLIHARNEYGQESQNMGHARNEYGQESHEGTVQGSIPRNFIPHPPPQA